MGIDDENEVWFDLKLKIVFLNQKKKNPDDDNNNNGKDKKKTNSAGANDMKARIQARLDALKNNNKKGGNE